MPSKLPPPGANLQFPQIAESLPPIASHPRAQPSGAHASSEPLAGRRPAHRDAVVLRRFGLEPTFAAEMRRFGTTLAALQLPTRARRPSQQAQRERLAYRRGELAPFRALMRLAGAPQPPPARRWAAHEAALLWHLGDLALLKGDGAVAQQRWWAAATAGRRRPPAWQGRLLSLLTEAGDDLAQAPALRALAQLHAEQVRVQQEPRRWFSRRHRRALRSALRLDPLLFLARFTLAANAYIT